ncbi:MAG: type II secretion system protein [Sedimentisphaerales bacterium]|jgi:type II secretory pathway pseudopilin PulG
MTSTKTKGFTIVELLTVMSIIIILMSVLVPGLARTRRYAKVVVQKGQFNEISKGLELYRNDHQETYPDSGATDTNTTPAGYCGAMKLCEALIGRDGMGNHPLSSFQAQQTDIYLFNLCTIRDPGVTPYTAAEKTNLQDRTMYTDAENIKAYRLQDIYNWDITSGASFYPPSATFQSTTQDIPNAVIGDVFQRASINSKYCAAKSGQKVGMPVLYYKADSSKIAHDATTIPASATPNTNIYNFDDNYAITALGCPWEGGSAPTTHHPMYDDPRVFLKAITNDKVTSTPRPHNEDGYILLSAGWDGLYGTQDDVYNFAK